VIRLCLDYTHLPPPPKREEEPDLKLHEYDLNEDLHEENMPKPTKFLNMNVDRQHLDEIIEKKRRPFSPS
jgi:hypothetical protein